MEYRLKTGEAIHSVDVEILEIGKFRATINGSTKEVDYRLVSDHQVHLNIKGRGINAYVAEMEGGKTILINGEPCFLQDADAVEKKASKKAGLKRVPEEVTPPMPAVVVRILVKEGEGVKEGQGLVVVSAMKMETTLKAPYPGCVSGIHCSEGDKVSPGMILVEIEKEGSS